MLSLSLLTLLATPSLATKLLLPLYQYPEDGAYDGVYAAIEAHPQLNFQIILNADSGPGGPEPDSNFATATAKLTSYANVQLLGYVHCLYGEADTSEVAQNVSDWASWNSATLSIDGIFYDETPNTPGADSDVSFMTSVVDSGKSAFTTGTFTAMFNPGSAVEHDEYWSLADYNVVFEDDASAYSDAVLTSNIPAGRANQSSILLPDFASVGDAAQAQAWLDAMIQAGVGSAHILNYGYMDATSTVEPAPISAVALVLAASSTGSTAASSSSSTTAAAPEPTAVGTTTTTTTSSAAEPTSEATHSAEATSSADAPAVTPAADPPTAGSDDGAGSGDDAPTVVVYTTFATSYVTVKHTATGRPSGSARPSGHRHSWGWSARHRTGMKKHTGGHA